MSEINSIYVLLVFAGEWFMMVQVGDLHTKQILIEHDWLLKDFERVCYNFSL